MKKIKHILNGVSTPFGGVSWENKDNGKEYFIRLITYLSSKRILINPIEMEKKEWSINSVLEIKKTLSDTNGSIPLDDMDISSIRKLINACNNFLDSMSSVNVTGIIYKKEGRWENNSYDKAMKVFRKSFKNEITIIEEKHKIKSSFKIPELF